MELEALSLYYLEMVNEDEPRIEMSLPRIDIISVSSSVLYICYLNC